MGKSFHRVRRRHRHLVRQNGPLVPTGDLKCQIDALARLARSQSLRCRAVSLTFGMGSASAQYEMVAVWC
jgi:hypothetical protein